jgi:hypothetical protein
MWTELYFYGRLYEWLKNTTILGAFTKLRKATVGFVISVSPSLFLFVGMEQLGSHGTDVHEI